MRCLRLAGQSIADSEIGDADALALAHRRLDLAQRTMHDMAGVLDRAMRTGGPTSAALGSDGTIAESVDRIITTIEPIAREHGVALAESIAPSARPLRAGVLGTLIRNGLENAVDACMTTGLAVRCVDLSIDLSPCGTRLIVLITDTGPGVPCTLPANTTTKPDGHGIGLELCRRIVASLGGDLSLMNVPFGGGAVLRIELPIERLEHS